MLTRLLPVLCVSAVVFVLVPTLASAAPEKKPVSPYETEILALHGVRLLLESADHDYMGHRSAALKEINGTIKVLQAGYAHIKHPKDTAKGNNEPQALSDAQLREAVKVLTVIQKKMSSAPGATANLSANALATAITEMEMALAIK
jgi:hypothetical protein